MQCIVLLSIDFQHLGAKYDQVHDMFDLINKTVAEHIATEAFVIPDLATVVGKYDEEEQTSKQQDLACAMKRAKQID